MKELLHINGQKLTFKFSPEGALSSAKLEKQDVTAEVRYLRESDYKELLAMFGFRRLWAESALPTAVAIQKAVAPYNLSILNITQPVVGLYYVFLCDSRDPSFIHKTTKVVLEFVLEERRFTRIVKMYNVSNSVCRQLLSEVHDVYS